MGKQFLFITFLWITSIANAQIHEAGVFIGGSNYIGDVGTEYYIAPNNFAVGVIYKYNLNPRIALRGTFTYAQITADDAKSKNTARKLRGLSFTNNIKELAIGIEFSFSNYGSITSENSSTPYILLEFAAFNYNIATRETAINQYDYKNDTSYSIPFGLGYKTKLSYTLAFGVEVGVRYTFKDNLDYNNNNIPSLQFGNPDSNDWYVFSGINLVYTFGRPSCYKQSQY